MSLRWRIALGLVTVYLLWGSTFLAIRVAVGTIPPFLMASARWTIAGIVLYSLSLLGGGPRPTLVHWRNAIVLAFLLIVASNGVVTWAETRVSSGVAALLIASVSLFMVLLDWLRPRGVRPAGLVIAGLVLGVLGVTLLVGPTKLSGAPVDRLGALGLLVASFSFASGSLLSPRLPLPALKIKGAGMEMIAGGVMLFLTALLRGEVASFSLARVTRASVFGLSFLIVFGSLVGFTVYLWLMRTAPPAIVSTYACVNPVVAVLLGAAFGGEPLTPRTLVATAVIVLAVGLIVSSRASSKVESTTKAEARPPEIAAAPAAARCET
ncbi:MAG TPA: EamA family transporter [Thermoanaerobaculia bacterium]|nr:EamA family transporter [Thermoanaerobaculia bacterium]